MAESFPSDYVDPQTGDVRQLGTIWDKLETDGLTKGADYALFAGKIALVASAAAVLSPVAAAFAVAVPVTFWLTEKYYYKSMFNKVYEASLDETKSGGEQYNMTTPQGQDKFDRHFGAAQPTFGEDYLKMVKMAGLKTAPTIIVREAAYDGWGRMGGSQDDYNAGAISHSDGSRPSIEIGQGVIEQMTPGELRAVIGHEITHLALGHTKDRMSWKARHLPNLLLTGALVGATLFGLVPILPALALIGASTVASTCLESINSRRREEACDRGAALLTGGTTDLADGLKKLKSISKKMLEAQIEQANMISVIFGRGKARIKVKEESALHRFMHATHPTTERRAGLLEKFEEKYHAFCEKQRSLFRDTFNARARRKPAYSAPEREMDPYGNSLGDIFDILRNRPHRVVVLKPRSGHGF
jgi:Zn-dependent protease with chaperone function